MHFCTFLKSQIFSKQKKYCYIFTKKILNRDRTCQAVKVFSSLQSIPFSRVPVKSSESDHHHPLGNGLPFSSLVWVSTSSRKTFYVELARVH